MTQSKFVKEIPIINGTYKKDTPNGEIGYQKWQVRKTYEDPDWVSDDYEWVKNEDGTNIEQRSGQ